MSEPIIIQEADRIGAPQAHAFGNKRYIFPPAVGNPKLLPELRVALLQLCADDVNGGLIAASEYEKMLVDITGSETGFVRTDQGFEIKGPKEYADGEDLGNKIAAAEQQALTCARWYVRNLNDAQLIYVDAAMVDVVTDAAAAAPPDLVVRPYDAPCPAGLVVFAKPVWGTDAGPEHSGNVVQVNGILWGPVRLPAKDVDWWDERSTVLLHEGVSIASFRLIMPGDTDELGRSMNPPHPFWLPLGRSDWLWDEALDEPPALRLPNANPTQFDSMMEDRRLLAALWATINQKRLVGTTEVPPDRYVRKRLARSKQPARNETVRVIHLRRSEHRSASSEPTGRHLTVRFPVRPHYRRQPYGPGRQLRRLTLIPGHWKGPEGAPVRKVETIWEVDR